MWFARFVSAQRTKTKRVNETTFYALIQYFAIILFECKECEDFLPAKHIMSLCFTYYQEVEVPGCDPYREYLFNYLRDQTIFHTLRFWNATLFYALQKDRVPKISNSPAVAASGNNNADSAIATTSRKSTSSMHLKSLDDAKDALLLKRELSSRSISETSLTSSTSSSSSDTHNTKSSDSLRLRNARKAANRSRSSSTIAGENKSFEADKLKLQENTSVAFSQLG